MLSAILAAIVLGGGWFLMRLFAAGRGVTLGRPVCGVHDKRNLRQNSGTMASTTSMDFDQCERGA